MTPETTEINNRHSSSRRGAVRGCLLIALALFIFDLFVCMGLGQPARYWYEISDWQIFDGPDSVVLFVGINLVQGSPGLVSSPANSRLPVRLLQIEVGRDGSVKRSVLADEPHPSFSISARASRLRVSFNTNTHPVLRLADAFYLVDWGSSSRPLTLLYKLRGDRIEPVDINASHTLLRDAGLEDVMYDGFMYNNDKLDHVSEKHGWKRVNQDSRIFFHLRNWITSINSIRHEIRLNYVKEDMVEALTAESLGDGERWTKSLLTVDTRAQRSYGSPPPLEAQ